MNIVVACMVFCLAAAQVWSEEVDWRESNYWPFQHQKQADLKDPAHDRYLMRIIKNLKPDKFYGSMGKRHSESVLSPKRQKIDTFIGLMGKRSLRSESEEWKTDNDSRRRK